MINDVTGEGVLCQGAGGPEAESPRAQGAWEGWSPNSLGAG